MEKAMMTRRLLISVVAVGTWLLSIVSAQAEITRINTEFVVPLINQMIQGMELRLNNHGPRHGSSWHVPNDSFVRLSRNLGGDEQRFDIDEFKKKIGRRRYLYYVNDVNLLDIRVSTDNQTFVLSLSFDEEGNEFKGHCLIKRLLSTAYA